MKFLFVLFILTFPIFILSQQIQGKIYDTKGNPIPDCNVGITQSEISTITDFSGSFSLYKDSIQYNKDSLLIESPGFTITKVAIQKDKELTIILEERVDSLQGLVIHSYSKKKPKMFGYKRKNDNIVYGWGNQASGNEIGLIVKTNKKIVLDKLCFYVPEIIYDSIKLRVRIRDIDTQHNIPAEDILHENVFITVHTKGEQCVPLSTTNLSIDKPFYVGLELISIYSSTQQNKVSFYISAKALQKGYVRFSSTGNWYILKNIVPAIQVHTFIQ